MEQYNITGMSCAACSNRVEKAVSKVEGVTSCSVSLLTNSMGVEGTASESAIIQAVVNAGYGASPKGIRKEKAQGAADREAALAALEDHETPKLKRRLALSVGFLLMLMYFSMGVSMWNWPAPWVFRDNMVGIGVFEMLLAIVVMLINKKFFTSGYRSLFMGGPNMDTLVALGSSAAFGYSALVLIGMTKHLSEGHAQMAMQMGHHFYFESAAMIVTLITVGKMLEAMSKGRTTNALKSLMKLAPKTAVIERAGEEMTVPIEEVVIGDTFVVRPGENIPVDGIVLEGATAVDESALTGESIPTDKAEGDGVSAATLNQSGFMKCRATRVGEDTTLSQIIQTVSDAAATKAPIAKVADKVSGVFVPAVIAIVLVTIAVWLVAGKSVGFALARGISVLVISCPCALGLATPVAIMVGSGMGAKQGIMFKTAAAQEETGRIEIVALDKTGTITEGTPKVTNILPADGVDQSTLVQLAASLEAKSEHPLAKAIMDYAEENRIALQVVTDFSALPGNGLSASYRGERLIGGSLQYLKPQAAIDFAFENRMEALAATGKTPLLFAKGGALLGAIAVADVIKADSREAIEQLKGMGIQVVMLTGDNERTAKAIGDQAGVDKVVAGVLPNGKEAVIRGLQKNGKVAMVGDGINDAPALTRADIGIAIGAGTDIAIDAADAVLMKSRLLDVPAAIRLSRQTLKNIHENLFWAFFYNVIGIPLAAGLYHVLFGAPFLNPMVGAAAMSLSSFCVVTNALRLNFFKMDDPSKDKKMAPKHRSTEDVIINSNSEKKFNNQQNQGETKMQKKTIKIEGMMCGHCENTVAKALESLEQVDKAMVSHTAGVAIVELNADVDDAVLTKAVEDKDYKVISIEG